MTSRRTRCVYAGAALLSLALTGCNGGDTALGTITFVTPIGVGVTVANPRTGICHRLGDVGVLSVFNQTGADILMYRGADCANDDGSAGIYVATDTSDQVVPKFGLWRSYRTVV
ncbi:hypothetical protein ABIA33_002256 [Streptacidiphilus sp. MAP12-16]|uniref:hypothetical protein n=1 Tax=Streptacidiphilus sp. MAP12-16 TaxID=3156300 RepID=UPI0035123FE2